MSVPAVPLRPNGFARAWLTLLTLVLSLAAVPPTFADPAPASVVIGGRTIPFSVTPYLGNDGQVYAPVDAVRLMGATFSVNGLLVTVTGANGRQTTVPFIAQRGHACVALQRVALALGDSASWQPRTATLTIRAKLEMVRQNPDSLLIYTSYPVSYRVQHIDNPSRLYVDLDGLDLAAAPAAVPVSQEDGQGTNVLRIRSGQISENTVRITIDLKHSLPYTVASKTQTDRIQVDLGTAGRTPPVAVAEAPPPIAAPVQTRPLPPMPVPTPRVHSNPPVAAFPADSSVVPSGPSVRITGVTVKQLSDDMTQIAVMATGDSKYRTEALDNPNRLAFDLPNATLDAAVSPSLPGVGAVIKGVRAGILRTGVVQAGRIVIDLSRRVGYSITHEVGPDGSVTFLINLLTPRSNTPRRDPGVVAEGTGNSLAGKVVVVDPGHGLRDSGALGPDGSMEKNFTLAIGRKLRDALQQSGATVYMTRDDDAFLPVMARPQVAVDHNADFFISVHCDSANGQNLHSGTTVYFHAKNAVCRRMAQDILNRVAEVSGIPANGTKSDTIRFQTGFGVLRGSPMPAVLVECGYMNSDADLAKLKDEATQQHIAEGIVAGLRDFIADRSAR